MKKNAPRRSLAVALPALLATANAVQAQQPVQFYGQLDVAIDRISKSEGDVQGTLFGLAGARPVPNSVAAPASTVHRLSNSLNAQSYIGLRGREELGGGWAARFQLESALFSDAGGLGSDGRIFGKHAWVGLVTPWGELRLGRQPSPMLSGYHLNTTERIGSTDYLAAGVAVNNLQSIQDNALSYLAQRGPWFAMASYSPNAGVGERISAARSFAVGTMPRATPATGEVIGGATSGAEDASGRGRSHGATLGYLGRDWNWIAAYHHNRFDVPVGLATAAGGFVPLFQAESYTGAMLGARYSAPAFGTQLAFNVHAGQFRERGLLDPKVRTVALSLRQPLDPFVLRAQAVQSRFTNFTRGRDTGFMLGADYVLSKRTVLYTNVGRLEDERGTPVRASATPLPLAGGPASLLIPLGTTEVPLFSGAGVNIGARTTLVAVGLRHSF